MLYRPVHFWTLNLSNIWPVQYLEWRPPGSSWCCGGVGLLCITILLRRESTGPNLSPVEVCHACFYLQNLQMVQPIPVGIKKITKHLPKAVFGWETTRITQVLLAWVQISMLLVNRPHKVVVVSSHLSIISRRHEMPGMFDNFKPEELFNTRVLGLKTGPNLKSALLRKALLNFTRTYQRYYWAPWLSIERHKQKWHISNL